MPKALNQGWFLVFNGGTTYILASLLFTVENGLGTFSVLFSTAYSWIKDSSILLCVYLQKSFIFSCWNLLHPLALC